MPASAAIDKNLPVCWSSQHASANVPTSEATRRVYRYRLPLANPSTQPSRFRLLRSDYQCSHPRATIYKYALQHAIHDLVILLDFGHTRGVGLCILPPVRQCKPFQTEKLNPTFQDHPKSDARSDLLKSLPGKTATEIEHKQHLREQVTLCAKDTEVETDRYVYQYRRQQPPALLKALAGLSLPRLI